jgi:hypothetical protein
MKHLHLLLFLILLSLTAKSQTYTGAGGIIPDDGSSVTFTINVNELPFPTIDTNWGMESVCINLLHTYDSDLEMALISPDNSFVDLVSGQGGGDDNFINTCFDGNSTSFVILAGAPFTGSFRPLGDLGIVNNGQNGEGAWKLYIHDTWAYADQGLLISWSITFGYQPSKPFPFESSNLPIIRITTFDQFIPDDPKLTAHMEIIDNGPGQRNHMSDPPNGYDGTIGIEKRGSSSQGFPKKSFGFETWDMFGQETEVPLLGMPAESDWILNAHYTDKTLMRNVLTYYESNQMGQYASRTRFCEVVLNGQYWGVYAFMEKIKRDSARVDIAKLSDKDTAGIDLTGGYILKIDKVTGTGGQGWVSPYPPPVNQGGQTIFIQYEYPGYEDLLPVQEQYIQNYVDTFETALYNFQGHPPFEHHQYMDIYSFVDFFILNEISRNVDGYRLSTFFFKDKGGRINMGPVWDFDLAWGNAYYCEGINTGGFAYQFGQYCPDDPWQLPFWWDKLMTDSLFVQELRCRWESLRMTIFDNDSIFQYINDQVALLNEGQQRNFTQWPILGVWVWPNPSPVPTTYEGEIAYLKLFIMNRLVWLDNNIPGECLNLSIPEEKGAKIAVYPNPVKDILHISLPASELRFDKLELSSTGGSLLKSVNLWQHIPGKEITLDISNLSPGIYFLKITGEKGTFSQKILKVN